MYLSKCKDLPTAFYTILGTTLFLFGNLIAQHSALALEGEPSIPTPYWLSAIDVFEIGDNLPIRTSGRGCQSAPEDWRMGIVWGRTLVCIAEEVVSRRKAHPSPPPQPAFDLNGMPAFGTSFTPSSSPDEPQWPKDSPFALIVSRRPPVSRRLSMDTMSPNELMCLAQDQFARGIFHMPHPQHSPDIRNSGISSSNIAASFPRRPDLQHKSSSSASTLSSSLSSRSTISDTFSRAKELYTIGSEVLILAEKLDTSSERLHWAHWADGIFSQMKMESDTDAWRGAIASARGRCCLVIGSAMAEELEGALEREEMEVLSSQDAEDAREALRRAVKYLESAMEATVSAEGLSAVAGGSKALKESVLHGSTSVHDDEDGDDVIVEDEAETESQELKTLLAEALLTLANLTADTKDRELLYAKAQKEGGGSFELDDEDRMDESG